MSKIDEALEIIKALGLPRGQQNERSALTLLALANVKKKGHWPNTKQPLLRIIDMMEFMRRNYDKSYAPNSRETVRRRTIHQFEKARIVDRNADDPSRPTNSGKTVYSLTADVVPVLKAFGTEYFDDEVATFVAKFGRLQTAYAKRRKSREVKLTLPDGANVFLSPGKHNDLQVAIIERMGPNFAPSSSVLHVGDTAKKHVVCDAETLEQLGIPINEHDKLPDIILFDAARNWLFLVEAVTSHGPVNPKRHAEIEAILMDCRAERIYITAFLTRADFRTYAADIAWETEAWIAENPGHMIHFNGPKFLGPYKPLEPGKQ